jgi:hypothetical protein
MPLHFCHPEAPHKKLRMPEWYLSTLMMQGNRVNSLVAID